MSAQRDQARKRKPLSSPAPTTPSDYIFRTPVALQSHTHTTHTNTKPSKRAISMCSTARTAAQGPQAPVQAPPQILSPTQIGRKRKVPPDTTPTQTTPHKHKSHQTRSPHTTHPRMQRARTPTNRTPTSSSPTHPFLDPTTFLACHNKDTTQHHLPLTPTPHPTTPRTTPHLTPHLTPRPTPPPPPPPQHPLRLAPARTNPTKWK